MTLLKKLLIIINITRKSDSIKLVFSFCSIKIRLNNTIQNWKSKKTKTKKTHFFYLGLEKRESFKKIYPFPKQKAQPHCAAEYISATKNINELDRTSKSFFLYEIK